MAENKYTGEVTLALGEKKCTLVYDWRALSELHTKFESKLENGLLDVSKINDPFMIAEALVIGLKKHNPEVTLDYILEVSPPLIFMRKPLDEALAVAYFGAEIMAGIEVAGEIIEEAAKKKIAATT